MEYRGKEFTPTEIMVKPFWSFGRKIVLCVCLWTYLIYAWAIAWPVLRPSYESLWHEKDVYDHYGNMPTQQSLIIYGATSDKDYVVFGNTLVNTLSVPPCRLEIISGED